MFCEPVLGCAGVCTACGANVEPLKLGEVKSEMTLLTAINET